MRLMGEAERKWEEMRSELQWDPGPCGVLCTRVRTWDFALSAMGVIKWKVLGSGVT